jgi:Fe-S-cluster containining protein
MGVDEIGKKPGEACGFDGVAGCAIYEKRPGGCHTFRCLWHLGILEDEDRPDKIGVMFDAGKDEIGLFFIGREVAPGGIDHARTLLWELRQIRRVFVIRHGSTTLECYG